MKKKIRNIAFFLTIISILVNTVDISAMLMGAMPEDLSGNTVMDPQPDGTISQGDLISDDAVDTIYGQEEESVSGDTQESVPDIQEEGQIQAAADGLTFLGFYEDEGLISDDHLTATVGYTRYMEFRCANHTGEEQLLWVGSEDSSVADVHSTYTGYDYQIAYIGTSDCERVIMPVRPKKAGTTNIIFSVGGMEYKLKIDVSAGFFFKGFSSLDGADYLLIEENQWGGFRFHCENGTGEIRDATVTSGDTSVVQVDKDDQSFQLKPGGYGEIYIGLQAQRAGSADISVNINGTSYKVRINVVPGDTAITDITQTAYQTIKLTWKKNIRCSGYDIERTSAGGKRYTVIQTIIDGGADTASVTAEWGKRYTYRVVGFVMDGDRKCRKVDTYASSRSYTAKKMGTTITSVKRSGRSSLKITWKNLGAATGYEVYRATQENAPYKKICTIKNADQISYTQKVKKGVTYYYKLATLTPSGKSELSPEVSQFIPQTSKLKKRGIVFPSHEYESTAGYYEVGGRMHVVMLRTDGNLEIVGLTSNMTKVKSKKIVKLGKYDEWGGYYQGTDGKFYVTVGYDNPRESKNKTVIKTIQYSSKWKKQKTAAIKGGVKNMFVGIRVPFEFGDCRMAMQGTTLYLHTCRIMFASPDGVSHQANISFEIDTKTMKATTITDKNNTTYVSHSNNQFVRCKGGDVYLLDRGDGYPKALALTMIKKEGAGKTDIKRYEIFKFMGDDEFTDCVSGGMEVGSQNVLTVGKAAPHGYAVKGVTGYGKGYSRNVYITVTNRMTGKTTVKWLTQHNPKTSKISFGHVRIVKLSDDRYAVLFTSQTLKNLLHPILNYIVVDGDGRKIYQTKYKDVEFVGTSSHQPALIDGKIVWLRGYLYSIPAVY